MVAMAVSVREICDNVRLAREMSMLGNYTNAEVFYEGSLQMISRLTSVISEPLRKTKWQDIQRKVSSEYEALKLIKNTLQTLKLDTSVDMPLGARRPYFNEEPVRDIADVFADSFNINSDPDVWPSPVRVDNSRNGPIKTKPVNKKLDVRKGMFIFIYDKCFVSFFYTTCKLIH